LKTHRACGVFVLEQYLKTNNGIEKGSVFQQTLDTKFIYFIRDADLIIRQFSDSFRQGQKWWAVPTLLFQTAGAVSG
jgi:hypothetical protein